MAGDGHSLLYVATVGGTVRQFLAPIATDLRANGWRLAGAASGVKADAILQTAFDDLFELPLSRSVRDIGGLVRGERAIARVLREARPDIVHVHSPIASFLTRLAVRRMPRETRPAVAYTAHGFHFHEGGRRLPNAAFLLAERIAGRWTDRLVVINDEDERAAIRHQIVPGRSLVRMPGIGVDTDHYARAALSTEAIARSRVQLDPNDAPSFVFVGEFSRNKRQSDAIAALAALRHSEARLVLLGDGPLRGDLETLADRLGVADRVVFAGIVADVRPIVAGSVALVLCSGREGLARSIMEALALEVPVVASTARGNRELVGDAGRIVDVGDVDGLAQAMDWLIDHPSERRGMGERGRIRMVQTYDLRVVIRLHETLYASMLADRSSPSVADDDFPAKQTAIERRRRLGQTGRRVVGRTGQSRAAQPVA